MRNRYFGLFASIAVCAVMMLPTIAAGGSGPGSPDYRLKEFGDWVPITSVWRDFETVVATLEETEMSHSSIAKVYDLGDSWEKTIGVPGSEGRDILAIKISDNVAFEEDEPEVLLLGHMHGNEMPSTEILLQLVENITDLYGIDARITELVDGRQIWILPVANPDGMEYSLNVDWWRKNRHDNGDGTFGVDLNRNFNGSENGDPLGAWGGDGASHDTTSANYCGEYAFSEPETQAIRDLVLAHDFRIAADYHSAADWLMWAWGYTPDPAPDNAEMVAIGMEYVSYTGYIATQSYDMYVTTGDTVDWMYGGSNIYAYCIEVNAWYTYTLTLGPTLERYLLVSDDFKAAAEADLAENIAGALFLIETAGDRSLSG